MSENRKGDWLETYTGIKFYPLDPRPEEVEIEDVAHALSNICRFNGHTKWFYPVSAHCVNLAYLVEAHNFNKQFQLFALLHDAAEAYICDFPAPIKKTNSTYVFMEWEILNAIFEKYNVPPMNEQEQAIITYFDKALLRLEAEQLKNCTENWHVKFPVIEQEKIKSKFDFDYEMREQKHFSFQEHKVNYLEMFKKLTKEENA